MTKNCNICNKQALRDGLTGWYPCPAGDTKGTVYQLGGDATEPFEGNAHADCKAKFERGVAYCYITEGGHKRGTVKN